MASNNVEIKVDVNVDGAPALGALSSSLDKTAQTASRLGSESSDAAAGMSKAGAAGQALAVTSNQMSAGMGSAAEQISKAKTELLALVGVGAGLQGIKDLSEVADSFKNLEAKIKLVTGEGKAFDDAFESVFDIAKRTNSAVEETGVLFTKLAEAGKTLGVSQAEALKLTETINQSIQLSGASAGASAAAIQQLVQGLQSGVLRGDEFNSVMEQAPRLAKALADGLGVGTGELRKMAEQGQLTSATVIKSLQGQTDAVQAEFGKLPATVGRAMTNLTTEFTRYIGEADKAGGYSAKLAGIIDSLAGNLSTVATVMIKVGQSVAALKLLSMAQDWLTAGAAIKATTAATTQHTAATAQNTVTKTQNTAAVVANTQAQVANAGGIKAAGAAASAASGVFGMFGKTLGTLFLVDFALNFKQYGTAIGEFAAKLMGAKDRTQELADAEKRASAQAEEAAAIRKRQNVALEEARERTFGLTKESSALIFKFNDLRSKGDSAADAIKSIGKDFDLSNVAGIKNAGAVLDTLKAKGELTADEFSAAWADALKGEDLAKFEVQARAAFAGTAREAERMAQVLDVTTREAIRRTGLDFEVISGGMGKASRMAINDTQAIIDGLDRLKGAGVDVGQALTASLVKGIKEAQTEKALAEVRQQVEQVRKALGDKVADGLLDQAKKKAEDLKVALENARPGINSVAEAMRTLGVTSDASLKETAKTAKEAYEMMQFSGTNSARELQDAFRKYAEASIAANGNIASETLVAEASMRNLQITTDSTGRSIVSAMTTGKKATEDFSSSVDRATTALERQNAEIERKMAAEEKAAELERKRNGVDKEGFVTNKDGQRLVAGSELGSKTGIYNFLKSAGVDNEAVARKLANDFTGGADFTPYDVGGTSGWKQYGNARSGDSLSTALLKAAQDYSFGSDARKAQLRLQAGDLTDEKKKIPKFASGGYHRGGIRLVGERGPELEVTGSSHIINAEETKRLLRENLNEQATFQRILDNEQGNMRSLDAPIKENQKLQVDLAMKRSGLPSEFERSIGSDGAKLFERYRESENSFRDYKKRLEDKKREQRKLQALIDAAPSAAPSPVAPSTTQAVNAPANNAGAGKQYTVNIIIGGKTTSVNTASDADALKLIEMLQSSKLSSGL